MILASIFTPYYILAVAFGAFAVIVSVVGMKDSSGEKFPGRLYGPIMLVGVVFAIATFVFVWSGGEKEVEHREHGGDTKSEEGASLTPNPLPVGLKQVA
jgi:hypothetical protein